MITKQDLNDCGVRFDATPHTYTRLADGLQLQGVTRMIHEQLYPDEFAGIDPETLAAKAAYGTARHREIQDMIVFDDEPETEAQRQFAQLMREGNLTPIASEYTVTDGNHFASNIDVVATSPDIDPDRVVLIDIKTVASLNRPKVGWQLSLYADFFEHCNPAIKVVGLYAAWLPKVGEPKLIKVYRRPTELLQALMQSWLNGEPFQHDSSLNVARIERMAFLKERMANDGKEYAALAAEQAAEMKAVGETSYSDDYCTLSYREATITKRFDTAGFRRADPATFNQWIRESATPETVQLRLKA